MIFLTTAEIVSLHEKMIQATGGPNGIRDRQLLESAIYGALAAYGDQEVYATIHEKAARLAFSIIKNHAFIDGNKRTGVFVMLMILRLNAIKIDYTPSELIALGIGIAEGRMDYEYIFSWVHRHLVKVD